MPSWVLDCMAQMDLSPVIAWRMYLTYVVPRLLYNLEVIKLTATQVTRIDY